MTDQQSQSHVPAELTAGEPASAMLRFDSPHPISRESLDDGPPPGSASIPDSDSVLDADSLQGLAGLHAEQLAEVLQQRERELDRREAALHARLAALDHRVRTERLAAFSSGSASSDASAGDGDESESLGPDDQGQFSDPNSASANSGQTGGGQTGGGLEQLAREQLAQLETGRQEFAGEQDRAWRNLARRRQRAAAERQSWEQDLVQRERELQLQLATVDQRQLALDKLHAEVQATHGLTLETRWTVEQVWAEITQQNTGEQVPHRIEEARRQLSDHYELAGRILLDRRREMLQVAQRLTQQRAELLGEQQDLQRWSSRLEAEAEEQAARLIAREQELDRRARRLGEQQLDWTRQQREFWESEETDQQALPPTRSTRAKAGVPFRNARKA